MLDYRYRFLRKLLIRMIYLSKLDSECCSYACAITWSVYLYISPASVRLSDVYVYKYELNALFTEVRMPRVIRSA